MQPQAAVITHRISTINYESLFTIAITIILISSGTTNHLEAYRMIKRSTEKQPNPRQSCIKWRLSSGAEQQGSTLNPNMCGNGNSKVRINPLGKERSLRFKEPQAGLEDPEEFD